MVTTKPHQKAKRTALYKKESNGTFRARPPFFQSQVDVLIKITTPGFV